MRSYFLSVVGIIYLGLVVLCAHSCSVTDCLGVACANGTCIDGKCNCNANYEGPSCKTVIRNKFLGAYKVTSSCFVNETYPDEVNYVATTNYTNVTFKNMSNLRLFVTATIVDSLDLNIPAQNATGGGQVWTVSGTGYINTARNLLTMSMTYVDAANNLTVHCTELYNKNQ